MKITKANKQGQIVIPIEMRKSLNIKADTYLKLTASNNTIIIEPLDEKGESPQKTVSFVKDENPEDFHFSSKNKAENNLSEKVDEILY